MSEMVGGVTTTELSMRFRWCLTQDDQTHGSHLQRKKSIQEETEEVDGCLQVFYILYYQSPYGHIISIHVMVNHIRSHRSLNERKKRDLTKKQWPGIGTWKSSPEIQAVLLPDMVYGCLYA